jgi:AcrR family transcriptional regulator
MAALAYHASKTGYHSLIMAQVKKEEVREAILRAAERLFRRDGYQATTLARVAREAGISPATVYVYFDSKLATLYAVYDPWLRRQLGALAGRLAAIREPRARLRALLAALWRDIPGWQNCFANNLIQALATSTLRERYDPALLHWVEARVAEVLRDTLPPQRNNSLHHAYLAEILMMAFDGFVIHRRLRRGSACSDACIESMCDFVLGPRPRRKILNRD